MAAIDFKKTLEKCKVHWEAAQRDNSFRYTVFDPVFVGEEYDGKLDGMNTFSTAWEEDEIISYDMKGFDNNEEDEEISEAWACSDWGTSPYDEAKEAIEEFADRNELEIQY